MPLSNRLLKNRQKLTSRIIVFLIIFFLSLIVSLVFVYGKKTITFLSRSQTEGTIFPEVETCRYFPSHLYGAPKGEWERYECIKGTFRLKKTSPSAEITNLSQETNELQVENVQPPSIQSFSTSLQTGDAVVSYNIQVPPAAGGFSPSLALGYSSGSVEEMRVGVTQEEWQNKLNSQGSFLGMGWSLTGISQIIKTSSGKYFLTLSGNGYELFPEETNDGRTFYHTKPESYLKIIRYGDREGNYEVDLRPWEVFAKDGVRYHFEKISYLVERKHECDPFDPECWKNENGHLCNSGTGIKFKNVKNYQKWAISWSKDLSGNQIFYEYDISEKKEIDGDCQGCGNCEGFAGLNPTYPKAIYPSQITYGKNLQEKVSFSYSLRDDRLITDASHPQRVNFFTDKKLEKIEVYLGNHKLRTYLFNFTYSDKPKEGWGEKNQADGRLLLASISIKGAPQGNPPSQEEFPVSQSFEYYERTSSSAFLLKKANNAYGGIAEYTYEEGEINPNVEVGNFRYLGKIVKRNRVKEKFSKSTFNPRQYQKVVFEYPYEADKDSYCRYSVSGAKDCFNAHGVIANEFLSDFEFFGYHYVKETFLSYENGEENKHLSSFYVFNQGEQGALGTGPNDSPTFKPSLAKGTLAKRITFDKDDHLLAIEENIYEVTDETHPSHKNFVYLKQSKSCADLDVGKDKYSLNDLRHSSYITADLSFFDAYGNPQKALEYQAYSCSLDKSKGDDLYRWEVNVSYSPVYRSSATTYQYLDHDHLDPNQVKYLVEKPISVGLREGENGNFLKRSWKEYYPEGNSKFGKLKTLRDFDMKKWSEQGKSGETEFILTLYDYDQYGNLSKSSVYSEHGKGTPTEDENPPIYTTRAAGARNTLITYDETYEAFPKTTTALPSPFVNTIIIVYDFEEGSGVPYVLGLPIKVIDPNNLVTQTSYDSFGRVIKVAKPGDRLDNPTEEYTYFDHPNSDNPQKVPFAVKMAKKDGPTINDRLISYILYDDLGKILQNQSEAPKVNGINHLLIDQALYDSLGRLIIKYSLEESSENKQPGCERIFGQYSTCLDNQLATSTIYDHLGRIIKTKAPDGTCTMTQYEGRRTYIFDPEANLTMTRNEVFKENKNYFRAVSYQKNNSSLSLDCSLDDVSSYLAGLINNSANYSVYTTSETETDLLGQALLTKIIKGKFDSGQILSQTTFSYDGFGRTKETFDPDLGYTRNLVFNALGQVLVQMDNAGHISSFVYDELSRLKESYEGNFYDPVSPKTLKAKLEYDGLSDSSYGRAKGKLVKEITPDVIEKTYYYHDPQEKSLLSKTVTKLLSPEDSFLNNQREIQEEYLYDETGRLKEIKQKDFSSQTPLAQEILTSHYDEIGRLVSISTNYPQQSPYLSNLIYNRFGLITEKTLGNNTKETLSYNESDKSLRLTGQEVFPTSNPQSKLLSLSYLAYDKVGNLKQVKDNLLTKEPPINYTYDGFYRLSAVSGPYTASYSYDELGRMTMKSEKRQLTFAFANFDPQNPLSFYPLNAPKSITQEGITLDLRDKFVNGNLTKKINDSSPVNFGPSFIYDKDNRLTEVRDEEKDKTLSRYTYDYQGQRVKKVENLTPSFTRVTYFLSNFEIVKEVMDGITTTTIKKYCPGEAFRVMKFDNNNHLLEGENKLYFAYSDYLSSTRVIADSQGNKITPITNNGIDYFPYGQQRALNGKFTDLKSLPSDHLYTDQILDNETKLYYYNSRYYDPLLGIFVSADPAEGPNRYSYVNGNPIMRNDPTGMMKDDPGPYVYLPRKPKTVEDYLDIIAHMGDLDADIYSWRIVANFGVFLEGKYPAVGELGRSLSQAWGEKEFYPGWNVVTWNYLQHLDEIKSSLSDLSYKGFDFDPQLLQKITAQTAFAEELDKNFGYDMTINYKIRHTYATEFSRLPSLKGINPSYLLTIFVMERDSLHQEIKHFQDINNHVMDEIWESLGIYYMKAFNVEQGESYSDEMSKLMEPRFIEKNGYVYQEILTLQYKAKVLKGTQLTDENGLTVNGINLYHAYNGILSKNNPIYKAREEKFINVYNALTQWGNRHPAYGINETFTIPPVK